MTSSTDVDVLVVGAGPTGLTLAAQLAAFGVAVCVVDDKPHPVMESRALALQPRTLEVLRGSVTEQLVERGNRAVQLRWHGARRTMSLPLFDMGMDDTAYPFLLFLSQAETEAALVDHLEQLGVKVEWETRFVRSSRGDEGRACELTGKDGRSQVVHARYLVGCDGAHSAVRDSAGIAFGGGRYPQTFLLADTDADGLEPDAAHVWFGEAGPLFFFPLRRPVAWRVLTPRLPGTAEDDLDALVEATTGGRVRMGTPVWSTAFQIHHRQAESYRAGSVFLAGDAAHIHSPAGAQGMNTGIQDAVNLGWKLALVLRGTAPEELLETYDAERRPVGAFVLRFTDRAFTAATSTGPVVRFARTHLAPRVIAAAARLPRARGLAFRTVSQLGIRYEDSLQGGTTRTPRPRPGERLPDVLVRVGGSQAWLHEQLTDPAFHLLLCGPASVWNDAVLEKIEAGYDGLVHVHRLTRQPSSSRDSATIEDPDGTALRRLRVGAAAQLLVRPDGHVAYRRDHTDLSDLRRFLDRWLGA